MKLFSILSLAGFLTLNLFFPTGVFAYEVADVPHVISRYGDAAQDNEGLRLLYVYSKHNVSDLQYLRVGANNAAWQHFILDDKQGEYNVFRSREYLPVDADTTFRVRGIVNNDFRFTDELVATGDVDVVNVVNVSKFSADCDYEGRLSQTIVHYGSNRIHPQQLAEARAKEMARLRSMIHFGGGIVRTSIGVLAEGIGTGGPNCGTCVATNGTAAVADAQAVGADGRTYRCRLYNSPATMYPNGGSGYSNYSYNNWNRRRR